jgi:ethanolamine transporter EutH
MNAVNNIAAAALGTTAVTAIALIGNGTASFEGFDTALLLAAFAGALSGGVTAIAQIRDRLSSKLT